MIGVYREMDAEGSLLVGRFNSFSIFCGFVLDGGCVPARFICYRLCKGTMTPLAMALQREAIQRFGLTSFLLSMNGSSLLVELPPVTR